MLKVALALGGALALASVTFGQSGGPSDKVYGPTSASNLISKMELEAVSHLHIYFGHQSVGGNILDGIQRLAAEQSVSLSIKEVRRPDEMLSAGIAHSFIAENGDPFGKLAAFQTALSIPSGAEIAMVKFCFLDIDANTEPATLFKRYRETIERIREQNPKIRFLHITTPLTTIQGGWKALIKRWIGKAPYGVIENLRRSQYNDLVRTYYVGHEPIFDLAQIESSDKDGKLMQIEWNGTRVPFLNPRYTSDGAHLNIEGRRLVAAKLITALANTSSK